MSAVDPDTGEVDPVNRWADEIDQPTKPVVLMTEAEALTITAEIKSWAGTLWKKLKEAHDGQAWRALGYPSWRAYLDGEFDISKSQGYRLIAHARAVAELDAAAGFTDSEVSPAGDTLTERDTRDLDIEAVISAVTDAFAGIPKGTTASAAALAADVIARIVGDHRTAATPQAPGTTKTTTTTTVTPPADEATDADDAEDRGEGEQASAPGDTLAAPVPASTNADAGHAAGDSGVQPEDVAPSSGAAGSMPPIEPAAKDEPNALAVALDARNKLNAAMRAMDLAAAVPHMDADMRMSFAGTLAAVQDFVDAGCEALENAPGLTLVQGAAS